MKKIVEKVSEITDGVKNKITGKQEEIAKHRMEICLQCDDRKSYSFMPDRCGICGCILEYKTRSMKSSCPKKLWVIALILWAGLVSCKKRTLYDTVTIRDTITHAKEIIIPRDSVVLIQRISEIKDTVVRSERVVLATKIVNDAIVIEAECPEVSIKDTSYVITTNKILVQPKGNNFAEKLLLYIIIVIIIVIVIKQLLK